MSFSRDKNIYFLALRILLITLLFLPDTQQNESYPQEFRRFEERAERQLQNYVERAATLKDLAAWDHYMQLSLSAERIIWEEETTEQLWKQQRALEESEPPQEAVAKVIRLYEKYQVAAIEWELKAEQYIAASRGMFQAASVLSVSIAHREPYERLLIQVEATLFSEQKLNLQAYEERWEQESNRLYQVFEAELEQELIRINAIQDELFGIEAAAFEEQIEENRKELRQLFWTEEARYRLRGINRYRARIESENLSAKLRAEEGAASAEAETIIQKAESESSEASEALLEETFAELALTVAAETAQRSPVVGWQTSIETVINQGLQRWEQAEEELYRLQLQWLEKHKNDRQKAENIWDRHQAELEERRSNWLAQLREKIVAGERNWQKKLQQFDESYQLAEQELDRYLQEELLRREKITEQLDSMVSGGGGALAEIKEARRYYRGLLADLPAVESCPPENDAPVDMKLACFYREQQEILTASLHRFERILVGDSENLGVEQLLAENMHSESPSQGLLRDRRLFAEELPEEIALLEESNFRRQLTELIAAKSEQFLLYRRDLEALMERNSLFVARTIELADKADFRWQQAENMDQLKRELLHLDEKYAEHRRELSYIIQRNSIKEGSAKPTAELAVEQATALATAQEEIANWFQKSGNENRRLKEKTADYFQQGYRGFYLTQNENDPYLMTRAEYEWELLRRERNYLARQLESAEAVKRYADLAVLHNAGAETAHVTAERAEIARLHKEVRELHYLALKGDLKRDEIETAFEERDIDPSYLPEKREALQAEIELLQEIAQLQSPTERQSEEIKESLADWLRRYGTAAQQNGTVAQQNGTTAQQKRAEKRKHRLQALYDRIEDYPKESGERSASWQMIQKSAHFLATEVEALQQSYNFAQLEEDIAALQEGEQWKPITQYRTELREADAELSENAAKLVEAEQKLQEARYRYSETRKQFDTLQAYNSAELIRKNLLENIEQLSQVLNRMQAIEDIGGLPERLFDTITAAHLQHFQAIAANHKAREDHRFTQEALKEIGQMEAARRRRHLYEDLVHQAESNDSAQQADLLITAKSNLLVTGQTEEGENSYSQLQEAFRLLETNYQAYRQLAEEKETAGIEETTETEEAAETEETAGSREDRGIDVEAAKQLLIEIALRRAIETLKTALQSEEEARLVNVLYLLQQGGTLSLEEQRQDLEERSRQFHAQIEQLVAESRRSLKEYLASRREMTFAELLTEMAAAKKGDASPPGRADTPDSTDPTDTPDSTDPADTPDSTDPADTPDLPAELNFFTLRGLPQERLELMLNWLVEMQGELEAAAATEESWQQLLTRLAGAAEREIKDSIDNQLANRAESLYAKEALEIGIRERGISQLENRIREEQPQHSKVMEIKAILGYYKIEAGHIERDQEGEPLYDENFLEEYGIDNPTDDPWEALGGELNGRQLEQLTLRLLNQWRESAADPLMAVAMEGLENAWRELAAARTYIERRKESPSQLLAETRNSLPALKALSNKALALSIFYENLESLSEQSEEEQQNSRSEERVKRIIAEIEGVQGQLLFSLFSGYDFQGQMDGHIDSEAQLKLQELLQLLSRVKAKETAETEETVKAEEREEAAELREQFIAKIGEQRRYFFQLLLDYQRQQTLTEKLRDHALLRGASTTDESGEEREETEEEKTARHILLNRFFNYRSYLNAGANEQRALYQQYLDNREGETTEGTEAAQSFEDFINGKFLQIEEIDIDPLTLFDNPNWQEELRSDSFHYNQPKEIKSNGAEGELISYPNIKRIGGNLKERVEDDASQYTFYTNLANHWLETVSQLNAALNRILFAARIADQSQAKSSAENLKQYLKSYDPTAENRNYNEIDTGFTEALQQAEAEESKHSHTIIEEKRSQLQEQWMKYKESADRYALAGRQDQIKDHALLDFLESIYAPAAEAMNKALAEYEELSARAEELENEYQRKNSQLVEALNKMALSYRRYEAARREHEKAIAVKDFAETPYLYQGKAEDCHNSAACKENLEGENLEEEGHEREDHERELLTERAFDAQRQFELATAALELAHRKLEDAAFQIESELYLPQFQAILQGLERGESYLPLEDEELYELAALKEDKYRHREELNSEQEERLTQLTERDIYNRYKELITSRAEHIKQSMRMVRLSKSAEIIHAEIERLEALVEAKRQAYEIELERQFGDFAEKEEIKARNSVYMRLAAEIEAAAEKEKIETSNSVYIRLVAGIEASAENFYNQFRAWYWVENENSAYHDENYNDLPGEQRDQAGWLKDRPTQREEIERSRALYNQLPTEERQAVSKWLEKAEQAGHIAASIGAFQGLYFSLLQKMGERDYRKYKYNPIALGIWTPVISIGFRNIAIGLSTCGLFGGCNWGLIVLGSGMVVTGINKINTAEKAYRAAQRAMQQAGQAALQLTVDARHQVNTVLEKQREYEAAKAQLDYFTKNPDLQTLKRRLIQWGLEHSDEETGQHLYLITDEDLKYIYDRQQDNLPNYIDQNGEQQIITAKEKEDTLDISALLKERDFLDSYGRRYDPTSIITQKPGELINGVYRGQGENGEPQEYTRIRISHHDGRTEYAYARLVMESRPKAKAYHTGEILATLLEHGMELRQNRRQQYITAGDAIIDQKHDPHFIFSERDNTFAELFTAAAGRQNGGREYIGYQMTYNDYIANQREVMQAELDQKRGLQLKDWELRAVELEEQYNSWRQKIVLIEQRGERSWNMAENSYLQSRRSWERKIAAAEDKAFERRERERREYFTNRKRWQEEMQNRAAETAIRQVYREGIQELNQQIDRLNIATLEEQNLSFSVEDIVQELRNEATPDSRELDSLEDMENFNTILGLSLATGLESSAGAYHLSSRYREAMQKQQQEMRIFANIQIQQQYLALVELLAEQIAEMNRQYENQVSVSAYFAGAHKAANFFVLKGNSSGARRQIEGYRYYNARQAIEEGLLAAGYNFLPQESREAKHSAALSDYYDNMFRYLQEKETVEVEAYFRTLSSAAQRVFDQIVGTGSQEERQNSREELVIGKFGLWAGKAPDWQENKNAAPLGFEYKNGFGELGAHGNDRAFSGRAAGFYYQLYNAQKEIAIADAKELQPSGGMQLLMAGGAGSTAILIANTAEILAEGYLQGELSKEQQIEVARNGIAYAAGGDSRALALADFTQTLLTASVSGRLNQEQQAQLAGNALSYFGGGPVSSSLLAGLRYNENGKIVAYDAKAAVLNYIGPAGQIAYSLYKEAMGYEGALQDTIFDQAISALSSIGYNAASGKYEQNGIEESNQQIVQELKQAFGITKYKQILTYLSLWPPNDNNKRGQQQQIKDTLLGLAYELQRRSQEKSEQNREIDEPAKEALKPLLDKIEEAPFWKQWLQQAGDSKVARFFSQTNQDINQAITQFEDLVQNNIAYFSDLTLRWTMQQVRDFSQSFYYFFQRDHNHERWHWENHYKREFRRDIDRMLTEEDTRKYAADLKERELEAYREAMLIDFKEKNISLFPDPDNPQMLYQIKDNQILHKTVGEVEAEREAARRAKEERAGRIKEEERRIEEEETRAIKASTEASVEAFMSRSADESVESANRGNSSWLNSVRSSTESLFSKLADLLWGRSGGVGKAANSARPALTGQEGEAPIDAITNAADKYSVSQEFIEEASQILAKRYGIDPLLPRAIFAQESSEEGFDEKGRLLIRFEAHKFIDAAGEEHKEHFTYDPQKRWIGQQFRENTDEEFSYIHPRNKNLKNDREWRVFLWAYERDPQAALKSISMGIPQIMGSNHVAAGHNSVYEMFYSFRRNLMNQLRGFFSFVQNDRRVSRALRSQNMVRFSRAYNGPGNEENYARKIAAWMAKFRTGK